MKASKDYWSITQRGTSKGLEWCLCQPKCWSHGHCITHLLHNHCLTISHTTSQPHLPQTPSFPGLLFTHPPPPIFSYLIQYTLQWHNLVAFLYCSKFFPIGFLQNREVLMHPGFVVFYYIISYILPSLFFWLGIYFSGIFPTHRTTSLPSLPVMPHLRPFLIIRKVFPSREAFWPSPN